MSITIGLINNKKYVYEKKTFCDQIKEAHSS